MLFQKLADKKIIDFEITRLKLSKMSSWFDEPKKKKVKISFDDRLVVS